MLFSILCSHQQCIRLPISPHPHQELLFSVFFLIVVILMDIRWYLIVALIFISLIMSNVVHLFIVFMDIFISSSEKCLFKSKGKLFLCSQYFLHQMCGRFFPTPTNFSVLRTLTGCHVKKSFIYVMVYFWPLFSFRWSICLSLCHDYTILVIVAL